jgi:hypothetical protein
MIEATAFDEMIDAGYYVKAIESDPTCMQTWKSRWPYICNHNKQTGVFTAFRLNMHKIGLHQGGAQPRKGRDQPLNYIEPCSGFLFVSPTTHDKTGLKSIAGCIKIAKKTRDSQTPIRICIVIHEDEGVVHGFDLGFYKVNMIDSNNFFHLEPFPDANDQIAQTIGQGELMGHKIYYNGRCFESLGEARFAVLLNCLNVPFQYEKRDQEIRLSNGLLPAKSYRVDFTLWPDDFRKMCYLEWKRYHPTLEEQEKMATLVKMKGTVGYIAWGEEFKQSIKWTAHGKDEDRSDVRGVRLMKFIPTVKTNGEATVKRVEGYYLACNDRAIGRVWEEAEPDKYIAIPKSRLMNIEYPFNVQMLQKHLQTSSKKISKRKWYKMMLSGRVKKDTIVCTHDSRQGGQLLEHQSDGVRFFKPKDASTLMFKRNAMHEDCTSEAMLDVFKYVETYTFETRL